MTSLQKSSTTQFLKPLISLQLKSNINYLVIGILLILGGGIILEFINFSSMSSSDGVVNSNYTIISPVYYTVIMAIWAVILGVSLSKKSTEKEMNSFIRNKKLQFFSQQAVFIIYALVITIVIFGAIYSSYIVNLVQEEKILNYLDNQSTIISFFTIVLLLFISSNIGYLYGHLKNRGLIWLLLLIGVAIYLILLFLNLEVSALFLICTLGICSVIFPFISYQVIKKVGEK